MLYDEEDQVKISNKVNVENEDSNSKNINESNESETTQNEDLTDDINKEE